MNMLSSYLPTGLLERTGWTLVHSVWQLALIGLVCSVVLNMMQRRSASLRYMIGCCGQLAMLLACAVTFVSVESGTTEIGAAGTSRQDVRLEISQPAVAPPAMDAPRKERIVRPGHLLELSHWSV